MADWTVGGFQPGEVVVLRESPFASQCLFSDREASDLYPAVSADNADETGDVTFAATSGPRSAIGTTSKRRVLAL